MRMQLLGLTLLLAAPAAAQNFEGVVTMQTRAEGNTIQMKAYLTDARQAMVMQMPASAGPMAGAEIRMVIDPATRKVTMLVPTGPNSPMPGVKGMKMVVDMQDVANEASDANTSLRKLGTSQTIAGMKCDDYEVTTDDGTIKMCTTTALGRYMMPEMSGRAGPPGGVPEWAQAFGNDPVFPLKVWNDEGTMSMEVISVERGAVPAAMLDDSPAGYMSAGGMMGGMRRGNN